MFKIGSKKIIPINALHNNLQVFGFRFESFAYLTDIKTMASQEIKKLKKLETLVVNALRIEPHISHFNLQEALDFIKLVKPKQLISHLLIHSEVEKTLPNNVKLAYDNLKISL